MSAYSTSLEVNISLLVFAAIFTVFLLAGTLLIDSRGKRFMKSFHWLLILNLLMVSGEAGAWILERNMNALLPLKLCMMVTYGCGSLLIVAYMCCVLDFIRERHKVSYLPVQAMTVCGVLIVIVSIVSVFNGCLFFCNDQGVVMDGPLTGIVWMYDPLSLTAAIAVMFYYREWLDLEELVCLVIYSFISMLSMLLKDVWYPAPEYLMTTFSLIMLFLLFYRDVNNQLLMREKKLAENRIAIAISQIQPHFIYNALSSIGELCVKDPQLAEQVIFRFAKYLRINMDSLSRQNPVRFEDELEYVKTYLWIEKLRFADSLEIVYDIQESDFEIPAISVQPIVENAVRHGMMGKEDVCHVRLSTRRTEEGIEIEIADDGIGFDPSVKKEDGRSHVGITNVRSRLETMVNGTLCVQSERGKGTVVIISIPKKDR